MRRISYLPPFTVSEDDGLSPDHHWFIDVDSDEYLELIGWLKGVSWQGKVVWFPETFPGQMPTDTQLVAHISAADDRDAMLIKLSL